MLDARLRAQSEGGRRRRSAPVALPPSFDVRDPGQLLACAGWALNALIRGDINAKQAHGIGHLVHQCHDLYFTAVGAERHVRLERMMSASNGELPLDLMDQDAARFNFELQPEPGTEPELDINGPNSHLKKLDSE